MVSAGLSPLANAEDLAVLAAPETNPATPVVTPEVVPPPTEVVVQQPQQSLDPDQETSISVYVSTEEAVPAPEVQEEEGNLEANPDKFRDIRIVRRDRTYYVAYIEVSSGRQLGIRVTNPNDGYMITDVTAIRREGSVTLTHTDGSSTFIPADWVEVSSEAIYFPPGRGNPPVTRINDLMYIDPRTGAIVRVRIDGVNLVPPELWSLGIHK